MSELHNPPLLYDYSHINNDIYKYNALQLFDPIVIYNRARKPVVVPSDNDDDEDDEIPQGKLAISGRFRHM